MKILKSMLLCLIIIFLSVPVFARSDGKVLIYYFKNLTGSDENNDLMYAVPVCIYNRLKDTEEAKRFSVIGKEAYDVFLENPNLDLWDTEYMRNSARKKKITKILFGFFYEEGDRIRINGKVYFTESGLILDITDNDEEYQSLFAGVKDYSIEDIRNCGSTEEIKAYKVPSQLIDDEETSRSKHVIDLSGSGVFPVGEWGDIYPAGFSANLAYTIFPKRSRVRLGFGPEIGAVIMGRGQDGDYVGSTLVILPVGGSIQYVLIGKSSKDWLIGSFSTGLTMSILNINNATNNSIDFYTKGKLSFVVRIGQQSELAFSTGLFSVMFSETPFNAVYGEMGFRSFIF